jgi:hypothetical protein
MNRDGAHLYSLARWISALLSPLSLPLIGIMVILAGGRSADVVMARKVYFWILILTVSVFTLVFPLLTLFSARMLGLVRSLELNDPSERPLMYMAGMVYMGFAVRYLARIPMLSPIFPASALGGVGVLLLCMLFNFGFKISVHGASAGALCALMVFAGIATDTDFSLPLAGSLLASGIIGFSRLLLGAHKPYQYYLGWLVGAAAQWVGMAVYYKIWV